MSLEVRIKKDFGAFRLDVDFTAENGVTALLGASGCGKSMTLKCIAGIEKPDEGRIVLDGAVLFDSEKRVNLPPQRRQVGYLFQSYALFPNMSVRQNILCGLCQEKDRAVRERRLAEMLRMMRLEGLENHRPDQLSGGQQSATRGSCCWTSPFPPSTGICATLSKLSSGTCSRVSDTRC